MRHQPNILWITLDSVRADHTSMHDYRRDTTPELQRIANHEVGNQFQNAIAHSNKTPTSVPSMLTGMSPSRHQMVGTKRDAMLPDSIQTVPELLSACGYQTIGISENVYAGELKKIDTRFSDFTRTSASGIQDFVSSELGISFLKYVFNTRSHGPGLTLDKHAHGNNYSFFTMDVARRKLRKTSEPFFCYIHSNEPHHPYIPPISYQSEYIDEVEASVTEAIEFAATMSNERWRWMAGGLPISDTEWEMLYAMYDATIKYIDDCVGRFFDFVQRECGETIVIITSDHGELFGEHGLLDHHSVLDDSLIHVPLITYNLSDVSDHTDQPTQHADIMQTLLSSVGADTHQLEGYDIRDQQRSVAISQGVRSSVDDENEQNYQKILQYNSDIDLSHLPESLATSARTSDFKLVRTTERQRLYKLPDEQNDVKHQFTSVFEDLSTFLDSWTESQGELSNYTTEDRELNDEMKRHLHDMGYL